ncbi:MAG: hypothetical protein J5829_02005 [Lachnospiraceae bacterium]|nr:hypothetical protein [Lachnospiraceae bacterium]
MMTNIIKKYKYGIAIILLLSMAVVVPMYARDHAARLKECLQTEYLYYSVPIATLNNEQSSDKNAFKEKYDDRYVVISGSVTVDSVLKNNKGLIIKDINGNKASINTSASEIKKLVESISEGTRVAVYGKLDVTGWSNDSYEIIAKQLTTSANTQFSNGSYVFYPNEEYNGALVDGLTSAKTVKYYIPTTWKDSYVSSALTNNGVKGFQYYLNALSPPNPEYPEIFSIFFFDYETYLEKVPTNPSDGDKKDIEEAIVRNILQNSDEKFKISIETIKDINETKMDYYSTTYRPKDGRDYRLEFFFRAGKKGITCMLYVYYPSEVAVKHVREVAYLIETMEVESKALSNSQR